MNSKNRLEDVESYGLFDTFPEKELDDIAELASLICGTPIALITVLDDKRQWFKSKKGVDVSETKVEDSFCQHTLHSPHEVLVVNDALKDKRFRQNKLVLGYPEIRFYADAPLVTRNNNVLGTLCVIDKMARSISKDQEKALRILARKAMDFLENQKILRSLNSNVKLSTERLVRITENIPAGIFEVKVDNRAEEVKLLFLSAGAKMINPNLRVRELLRDSRIFFSLLHPDDIMPLRKVLVDSIEKDALLYHEYRVKINDSYKWHAIRGKIYKNSFGEIFLYGSISDITHHHEYRAILEQISFDISHVLRRPVTSLLGIIDLINSEQEVSSEKLLEYYGYIKTVADELEAYTRRLNEVYSDKKKKIVRYNN
ncbi:MAG: GAF domain-containing protein [Lunatimonas sp.]|uniref:GAF domain-containing protein n=1 Tax=Lunatimonas sp. TaxID=2060141 RepID=UPI00263A776E|nr:GAF domain-containing protein [Lunatimonas sp.]MCC5938807.1 GAF domain-containing protein [Lunatimonas sp.]